MTDPNPVDVHPDPADPEKTVVKTKFSFNRQKVARALGIALAIAAGLAVFGGAMKERGKDEFIEDVRTAADAPDETDQS